MFSKYGLWTTGIRQTEIDKLMGFGLAKLEKS